MKPKTWEEYELMKARKSMIVWATAVCLSMLFWLALFLVIGICHADSSDLAQDSPGRTIEVNMDIIATIESSNNPKAYNKYSHSIGLYQISPICLADYNQYNIEISEKQLYDPYFNEMVARWYMFVRLPQLLRHFGHDVTIETLLVGYNCGVGCIGKPLPRETINYINKYKKESENGKMQRL